MLTGPVLRRLMPICALVLLARAALALPDFTLVHLTDLHVPYALSAARATVAALPRGPVELTPYQITAPAPSLALATGDLTEFGGGRGAWEQCLELFQGLPSPVHLELGNHDNTWDPLRPQLVAREGGDCYAFDFQGARFIGFDTATLGDPRPSVPTEGLNWLRAQFARTPPEQPIFFFCHHPLEGTEFSSPADCARLLDLLRTRNVVLALVGHGHSVRAWKIGGVDFVMGGSTFGPNQGYGIVSVKDNVLRVCYQRLGTAPKLEALLAKPLPERAPWPQITGLTPDNGHVFRAGEALTWTLTAENPAGLRGGWQCGDQKGDLATTPQGFVATVPREGLAPGAHTVRLEITDAQGLSNSRTVTFWLDEGPARLRWVRQLEGAGQATPVLVGDRLYVADNAGGVSALARSDGSQVCHFVAQAPVRGGPVAADGLIFFGSAAGTIYALDPAQHQARWELPTGRAITAPLLLVADKLVCVTTSGEALCLERATGKLLWRTPAASYSLETAAVTDGATVYCGAWDRYVHALDLATGAERWKALSQGADRAAAADYYSPGDCSPVVLGGKVWVCDRGYYLTGFEAATGQRLTSETKCAAVAPGADGQSFYVRHTDNRVTKRTADGTVVWTASVPTGYVPTPPVAAGANVWVVSSLGTLSKLRADNGALLGQYAAAPGQYVLAAPAVADDIVSLVDLSGNVITIEIP